MLTERSLRAAATAWLRPRAKAVWINAGRTIAGVSAKGDQVAIQHDNGTSVADHALLATGYRIDISKLGVLAPELLPAIRGSDGYPLLYRGFESSVPGLHFVGATAVKSFGPLPRFVAGAGYAARCVTRAALGSAAEPVMQRAPRPTMQPQA